MKNLKFFFSVIITIISFFTLKAQELAMHVSNDKAKSAHVAPNGEGNTAKSGNVMAGAFGEAIVIETKETTNNNKLANGFYREAKALPANMNGFAIQLTTSMEQLNKDNQIFAEFGNLLVEETLNPKYCYVIGGFNTEEGAQKHLDLVISSRYPNAKVIEYKNGKRVN